MLRDQSSLDLTVNGRIYPLEAVMAAAYTFLDRAYVLLDKDKNDVRVRLWPKEGRAAAATEGDFYNELLNEALRLKIAKQNQQVREMVINRALFAATNTNVEEEVLDRALDSLDNLDDLNLDLDSDNLDFLDDPLGIAVPWEEKFAADAKKKEGEGDKAAEKPGAPEGEAK
jgi:His-Xaa-Ser system protein HxsD